MAAPYTSVFPSTRSLRIYARTKSLQQFSMTAYAAANNGLKVPARSAAIAESSRYRWSSSRGMGIIGRGDMGLKREIPTRSREQEMSSVRESYKRFSTSIARGNRNKNGDGDKAARSSENKAEDAKSKTIRDFIPPPEYLDKAEYQIHILLTTSPALHPVTFLSVKDVSGGCGSMYSIEITAEKFKGLSVLKQQRLVLDVLGKEKVGGWHGVQIKTSVS